MQLWKEILKYLLNSQKYDLNYTDTEKVTTVLTLALFVIMTSFQSKPVATLSLNFRAAVSYLAREFLLGRRKQEFYGKICFLNSHPKINRQLLDYAVTSAVLSENDFSHDLLSPLEVPSIYEMTN